VIRTCARVLAAALLVLLPVAQAAALSLADLERSAAQMRDREAAIWKEREASQRTEVQKQEQLANDAVARRNRADARTKALDAEWTENEARIAELKDLLHQREGNLGELFGVTRQIAGDAATVLQQSMLSAQYTAPDGQEPRDEFMRRIAAAKALPSIVELERMWFELHREMTETSKVERFNANVKQLDGTAQPAVVTRVGPFTATANGQYLRYDSASRSVTVLPRSLPPSFMKLARDLEEPTEGFVTAVVDPARGALIGMFADRPNVVERIQHGEAVNYVIIAVGAIGVLVSLFQYIYLVIAQMRVNAQLRNLSQPSAANPLGRLLLAMKTEEGSDDSAEIIELKLSEAVLKEVPRLQRFQSFLRLAVAAGPLLGLVGTVIGMIITFHAITASGSSDPKLMAHGIGAAMIATVLGLGIAIPLLFLNQGMTALSNGVTRILDEQSQALLADELARRNPFTTRDLDEARRIDRA
jgi:biopolymer transport protein ExbB